jgi:hypothetical protein
MSYTPEQLTTLQHVIQDMDVMRDRRLRELGPDEVLGEPEPDVVKVSHQPAAWQPFLRLLLLLLLSLIPLLWFV